MPSLTEGWGLVLAEAMAVGLPCVATDCSAGVRLLSAEGTAARIVPRADVPALVEALDALMSAPGERQALGAVARESVSAYRADRVIDRWEEMIAAVLR
jgi:glycosyltransferase involved in cell wall biosynthesis